MGAITMEVTLRRSGGSVSATIPSEMARRFHLAPGDRIEAIETEQGILLSPFNPTLQEALALASEAARSYQPALRQLAQ
ncbi:MULTISPECIES: AbrB/MazE/SpoVT family DNA-binding domain-containing protein [Synechococcus]|jgi:putative addiction module antidote|uniref:AbrB/MazE/SpoVT family DNA-binding domain-containing protein n=2 Tax=Synechococcus TaxID=1129 RepID=A0A2P7EAW5_9SYNE|nr:MULTISPECIES: AbrB/MazE/SpoVT family DNA-binding domain-containing protein [Synechococcus]MCF8134699.1 AbrB/MazE/SpoVT family DNA-binding domain-containing protein [Synechococcus lacustris]PSI00355.1 AbrB/MazE/SpoVT family DNA-binding domain-containing protein [Synechococcus lacustris str. Tous]MCP9795747.1 AbrB/MazE/SpoVT family DNA-binding domain-containing protein [Synechococcus lacustris L1F-Slac]MCP9812299.1 AbrB/MazE/SpoVT family DNA-binding domain-containing protein [Synechococcus lac